jgi:hypothetical protein
VVEVAQFRSDFPAFQDAIKFPATDVSRYLVLAAANLALERWRESHVIGQELYAAHFLALDELDMRATQNGGAAANSQSGPMTSKSVGSVSVSYDLSAVSEADGGHWNQTGYGRRFLRMAKMAGMGGLQLGGNLAGFRQDYSIRWPPN